MASLERQSSDDEFLNCQTSAAPPMEQQNWPYPSDNLVGSLLNWRGPENHQSIGISGLKHPESYSSGRNMASLERQSSDDEFLNCQTSAAPPMEQQNWPYPSDNLVGSLLNWRGPENHQSIGISGVQANPWQQLKNTKNMKLHTDLTITKKLEKINIKTSSNTTGNYMESICINYGDS
ncbi:hypothetical protein ACLKA6_014014 [Drosophila palustris]